MTADKEPMRVQALTAINKEPIIIEIDEYSTLKEADIKEAIAEDYPDQEVVILRKAATKLREVTEATAKLGEATMIAATKVKNFSSIATLMSAAGAYGNFNPTPKYVCPLKIDREPKAKRTIINKKGRKSKKKRGW